MAQNLSYSFFPSSNSGAIAIRNWRGFSRQSYIVILGAVLLSCAFAIALHEAFWSFRSYDQTAPDVVGMDVFEEVPTAKVTPTEQQENIKLQPGDNLFKVLSELGIERMQAHQAITALSKVFNPRNIKAGQEITVSYKSAPNSSSYSLLSLYLRPTIDQEFRVNCTPQGGFEADKSLKKLIHNKVKAEGTIKTSLYKDALKKGIPANILREMIRILSYSVDFQRDLKTGHSFQVLFENITDEDKKFNRAGQLLYAKLSLGHKPIVLYYHQPAKGAGGFYNEKGESMRRALLRTPVDGARLSSGYGMRLHPILGYTRKHTGVDFAAPYNTPIMAAGDGVVEKACHFGGYGNYVRIRHNGEYSTAYAHLCRFANGIRPGTRVRQGQIIGYMGRTGLATNVHLHFELLKNGRHTNPIAITKIAGEKLTGNALKQFMSSKAAIDRQLLKNT